MRRATGKEKGSYLRCREVRDRAETLLQRTGRTIHCDKTGPRPRNDTEWTRPLQRRVEWRAIGGPNTSIACARSSLPDRQVVTVRVDNDATRICPFQPHSTSFQDKDGGRDVVDLEGRLVTAPRTLVAQQFEMGGGV